MKRTRESSGLAETAVPTTTDFDLAKFFKAPDQFNSEDYVPTFFINLCIDGRHGKPLSVQELVELYISSRRLRLPSKSGFIPQSPALPARQLQALACFPQSLQEIREGKFQHNQGLGTL